MSTECKYSCLKYKCAHRFFSQPAKLLAWYRYRNEHTRCKYYWSKMKVRGEFAMNSGSVHINRADHNPLCGTHTHSHTQTRAHTHTHTHTHTQHTL
jgi:hypothetical protein